MVSALIDGVKASDFRYQGKEVDLKIMLGEGYERRTHLLEQLPIATPSGQLVTLGSVAEISQEAGPVQINHRERERVITLRLNPAERMPIETAMELIEEQVLGPMTEAGKLGGLYRVSLSGTADKLAQTGRALQLNLVLALVITYLLLSALFESFLYPFVIMFSVPLAALGGFLGLKAINLFLTYQPLDVLTMLGFIILIGTVVNNAILIVHQSLNHIREEGLPSGQAIGKAVEKRIRPIFMSVSTSVFAMLPLVLFPGPGSELYRGLGGVVIGGLVVSTIFTIFLVPALFSLTLDARTLLLGQGQRLEGSGRGLPLTPEGISRSVSIPFWAAVLVQAHACSAQETRNASERLHKMSEIERLHAIGALGPKVLLIHCGWLSPMELILLSPKRLVTFSDLIYSLYRSYWWGQSQPFEEITP